MAHALAHTAGAAVRTAVAQTAPIPGLDGRTAFVLIAVVVVVVAAVAAVPLIMDVRQATAWRRQLTDRLIDQAASDPDVRDLLRDLREPRGVRGLTRSVIALLILALVGFALAVAMLSSGADSGDLRKTIVTSLMTVLATVAGFYFGSLGAQNSAEDARRHASTATRGVKAVATATSADVDADAAGAAGPGIAVASAGPPDADAAPAAGAAGAGGVGGAASAPGPANAPGSAPAGSASTGGSAPDGGAAAGTGAAGAASSES